MQASIDPISQLTERFADAIARAFPQIQGVVDPIIKACNQPELGDFQCNAAMPLAKRVGMNPREVAKAIIAAVDATGVCEPLSEASIAGPGFINIRLREDSLVASLLALDRPDLGIPKAAPPQTIVVDLMGVNLAKQMHVGHLRSPIIGDAIARTFERLGHKVVRQNHVGDWGLPIAMVVARLMKLAEQGKADLNSLTLDQLDAAYKAAQFECQRDLAGLEAVNKYGLGPKALAECEAQVSGATEAFTQARQTLVKLQTKDPATYAVWEKIRDVTMAVCLGACKRLHVNVTAEHNAGESSYADELAPMVDDLVARGIAEPDQGALIVRLEAPEFGSIKEPCLIRKTDGGYLYATTDIAAIRRRVQKFGGERIIYCIDARQNLHLRQVFGASIKAGYAIHPRTRTPALMEHAAFGSVLGANGQPLKTRSGENIPLESLLEETVQRAGAAVKSRNPEMSDDECRTIAEAVGMAALKYADLCNDRVRDYMFSFDRMLAFEGNTGPYLLYALVRIKSIFRKAAERAVGERWKQTPPRASEHAEKQLALALLRYPGTVHGVAQALEPHRLCQYLFELAGAFSSFFDRCPVLPSEGEVRDGRLRLCDITARVLEDGLHVLGIPTLERM
ncbi:MAG: arginine--tRNA ligase [Planctomycetes bacterium]|nr:arginine--tRNA ligase [Planctomycetota bacterium]